MIIQCPSCNTKFSIDSAQLQDVRNPRFHCSRCDHFFDFTQSIDELAPNVSDKENTLTKQLGSQVSSAAMDTEQEAALAIQDDTDAKSALARQLDLLPTAQTVSTDGVPRRSDNKPKAVDIEQLTQIKASWPDAAADTIVEVDMRSALEGVSLAALGAHESKNALSFVKPEQSSATISWPEATAVEPSPVAAKQITEKPPERPPEELPEQLIAQQTPLSSEQWPAYSERELEQAAELKRSSSTFLSPELTSSSLTEEPLVVKFSKKRPPSRLSAEAISEAFKIDETWTGQEQEQTLGRARMKKTMELVTPIAIFLSLPLLITCYFWLSGKRQDSASSFFHSLASLGQAADLRVAPSGLELTDLQSTMLTLDDGKQLLEIRGNILNATPNIYGQVLIEAKVFDQQNQPLSREIVDANNSLTPAEKISALKTEAIYELQQKSGSAGHKLKPNDRFPFGSFSLQRSKKQPGIRLGYTGSDRPLDEMPN